MGNENFIRFPGTKYEALALLYVKSRELSEMSRNKFWMRMKMLMKKFKPGENRADQMHSMKSN